MKPWYWSVADTSVWCQWTAISAAGRPHHPCLSRLGSGFRLVGRRRARRRGAGAKRRTKPSSGRRDAAPIARRARPRRRGPRRTELERARPPRRWSCPPKTRWPKMGWSWRISQSWPAATGGVSEWAIWSWDSWCCWPWRPFCRDSWCCPDGGRLFLIAGRRRSPGARLRRDQGSDGARAVAGARSSATAGPARRCEWGRDGDGPAQRRSPDAAPRAGGQRQRARSPSPGS